MRANLDLREAREKAAKLRPFAGNLQAGNYIGRRAEPLIRCFPAQLAEIGFSLDPPEKLERLYGTFIGSEAARLRSIEVIAPVFLPLQRLHFAVAAAG